MTRLTPSATAVSEVILVPDDSEVLPPPWTPTQDPFSPHISYFFSLRRELQTLQPPPSLAAGTRPMTWEGYLQTGKQPIFSSPSLARRLNDLKYPISMILCLDASELGLVFHPRFDTHLFWKADPKVTVANLAPNSWVDIFERSIHAVINCKTAHRFLIIGGLGSICYNSVLNKYNISPSKFNSWFGIFSHCLLQLRVIPGMFILLMPTLRGNLDLRDDWTLMVTELICNLANRPDLLPVLQRTYIVYTPGLLGEMAKVEPPLPGGFKSLKVEPHNPTITLPGGFKSLFTPSSDGHGIAHVTQSTFAQWSDHIMAKAWDGCTGNTPDMRYVDKIQQSTGNDVDLSSSFGKSTPFHDRILPAKNLFPGAAAPLVQAPRVEIPPLLYPSPPTAPYNIPTRVPPRWNTKIQHPRSHVPLMDYVHRAGPKSTSQARERNPSPPRYWDNPRKGNPGQSPVGRIRRGSQRQHQPTNQDGWYNN